MSIEKELDRLESLILDSPRLPLGGRTFINEEEALDILDRVRVNLPTELAEAQNILKTRDSLLAQARQQASQVREQARLEGEQVIAGAKREAERYLNESELLKTVEAQASQIRTQAARELENYQRQAEELRERTKVEAERMLADSQTQASAIQDEADLYAEKILAQLELNLDRTLQSIRAGRQQLKKSP